jgi:hypothetical protein
MKKLFAPLLILLSFTFFSCKQKPDCSDGIHNQGETLIDCGGPCAACATCFDGIQNQGETGIDCGGGVCTPCQTCTDGIQNQGETGIDCGGPCSACPFIYPFAGNYGPNLLRTDTITVKSSGSPLSTNKHYYSLKAQLPQSNSVLRVVIKSTGGNTWSYVLGSENGWSVDGIDPATVSQKHNASGKIDCDIKLFFNGQGSATIEIYENNQAQPVRSRSVSW